MLKAKIGGWRKVKGAAHMPGGGYIARLRATPVSVVKDVLQAFGVHHEVRLIMLNN